MKSLIRVLTLFLAMSLLLTACGLPLVGDLFPSETSTPAPATEAPVSFGAAQPQQTPEMVS